MVMIALNGAAARGPWRGARLLTLGVALLVGCVNPGTQPEPRAMLQPAALGIDRDALAPQVPLVGVQALGAPELDALIAEALMGQPTVHIAQARLERAAAEVGALRGSQDLQLGLAADLNRQRFSENGLLPAPLAGSVRSLAALRLNAALELDFFGRHQAALRAALGQAQAARAELQAVRVVLVANVARSYIALARALSAHEVAGRWVAQREAMLELVRQRVRAGLDTALSHREAELALAQARVQREEVSAQVTLIRHQLAVLAGRAPGALEGLQPRLDDLQPVAVPDRLDADWLGRRPDILAARWRVEASLGARDYVRTLFYPNLNLVGFLGVDSVGLQRWFEPGSRVMGIAPALRLPIFDAGQLRAQWRGRHAELDGAIASYNGVVLEAVRDAADALSAVDALARQRTEHAQALVAAQEAHALARQRFDAGLGSYLNVLAAETPVLAQRWRAMELKAQQLDAQVALMRAFGGTWQEPGARASSPKER